MNQILVAYDIESDKLRLKLANKLLYFGLIRIQHSVFLGDIVDSAYIKLMNWLEQSCQYKMGGGDRILVLPVTFRQLQKIVHIGESPIELVELINPSGTIFIS